MVHHLVGRPTVNSIPSLGMIGIRRGALGRTNFWTCPWCAWCNRWAQRSLHLQLLDVTHRSFRFFHSECGEWFRRNLARNLTWIWKGFFFTNWNMNLSFLGYTATPLGKHIVETIWVAWGLWNQELHCNKFTNHKNYGNYGIPSFVDPWFMDPSNCFLHPSGQEILYHLGLEMG